MAKYMKFEEFKAHEKDGEIEVIDVSGNDNSDIRVEKNDYYLDGEQVFLVVG